MMSVREWVEKYGAEIESGIYRTGDSHEEADKLLVEIVKDLCNPHGSVDTVLLDYFLSLYNKSFKYYN